jgi:hypothetical protein
MKHLVHVGLGHGLVHDFSLMGKDQVEQDIRMVRIKEAPLHCKVSFRLSIPIRIAYDELKTCSGS